MTLRKVVDMNAIFCTNMILESPNIYSFSKYFCNIAITYFVSTGSLKYIFLLHYVFFSFFTTDFTICHFFLSALIFLLSSFPPALHPFCLQFLDCLDYPHSIFQTPRSIIKEPSAPPVHIDTPGVSYLSSAPPLQTSPPTHSSASLIKAIREELLRLSQKQSSVPSYHT